MDTVETTLRNDWERLGCFFRAVAFQLLQLLKSDSCPENISQNLPKHGLSGQTNAEDLSEYLRQLTVDEFQKNLHDYRLFFEDIDLYLESEKFRRNGEFTGRLGDALPLAMTNVLNIPILILTTVHNMPFLSLAPRTSLGHDTVIYLSYIQDGPGHYDALVISEQVSETAKEIPTTDDPHAVGKEGILVRLQLYK